ncbi:hypothetical protein FBZ87_101299 [Nitrospirillum amazonense]|uniref:Uncharacterized protein n=1 Tax=Nitrospirillum amazonense TaxID=28077 RepID=A0A560KH13_9PROT|nr:hypothetical protein [Nitrospirillum amazonense]TWB82591.1 hypothetical protein FBZ87_101299 [Nitrospirillum amazonense]
MIRATDMIDAYKGDSLVYRWSLVDGRPRCADHPADVATASLADIAGQLAINRAIRALQAQVDAYDDAVLLASRPEPDATVPLFDDAGAHVGDQPNPAHAAWAAAGALLANAPAELLHLIRTRDDALETDPATGLLAEAPFELVPPPLPTFDPATETVDLVAGAWSDVRPLTAEEATACRALMLVRWPRVMTPRDAIAYLLTPAEWLAISTSSDPEVRATRQAALGANTVDLDNPATAAALQVFQMAGLLSSERAKAILAGERRA